MSRPRVAQPPEAQEYRATVLVADARPENLEWVQRSLDGQYHMVSSQYGAEALRALGQYPIPVVIVGETLADMTGPALLAEARKLYPRGGTVYLLLAEGRGEPAGRATDPDGVFYVLHKTVSVPDFLAVVRSAVAEYAAAPTGMRQSQLLTAPDASRLQQVLSAARRLALQNDRRNAARLAGEAVEQLLEAERAYCLLYDGSLSALWSDDSTTAEERRGSARCGLAGFAARTGGPAWTTRACDDPRYDRTLDDPTGRGDERIMVQPILRGDSRTLAVLIAVRAADRPVFSHEDADILAALATHFAPFLSQLALQEHTAAILMRQQEIQESESIFRREAIDAHEVRSDDGNLLRISPAWTRWSYWVLLAFLIAGAVYMAVGRVNEYASGPAVVRVAGRTDITAPLGGTITDVLAVPGLKVKKGDVLVRFYDAQEVAEYEETDREFELELLAAMTNPGDQSARQALASLSARRERAAARLEDRTVRAPHAGVVSDVRIRAGQTLQPGEEVLTLVGGETGVTLVAMLPGSYRPQLKPGMTLRLQLVGHRYVYQELTIDSVGEEVVGPAEVRRYLGPQIADSVPLGGPVVLVTALMPSSTFIAEGKSYEYHDGMPGLAEVRVRSESILVTLVPGLKGLVD